MRATRAAHREGMEITMSVPTDVQLATSAEAAGDAAAALAYLMRALAASRTNKRDRAGVHWLIARFHARRGQPLRTLEHVSLGMLASAG
jgi:hypothetical protein